VQGQQPKYNTPNSAFLVDIVLESSTSSQSEFTGWTETQDRCRDSSNMTDMNEASPAFVKLYSMVCFTKGIGEADKWFVMFERN
jgi:hypothetical protein